MEPRNPTLDTLTPSLLWTQLDSETRGHAARCLYGHSWGDGTARRQADRAIAAALRFREVTVRQLSVERRIDYLVRAVHPDDTLAHSLLMALHLKDRQELLGTFLDALQIPHREGLIEEEHTLKTPDAVPLARAANELYERFPEPDVTLYLTSLLAMDREIWGGLAELIHPQSPAGG